MATEFTMPKLGLTMEEATIIEWLVPNGGDVTGGSAVMRIETDKVETEVEISIGGVLHQVGQPGDVFPCGAVIAYVLAPGEAPPATPTQPTAPATSTPSQLPPPSGGASPIAAPLATADAGGRLMASPNARRIAAERGIDLRAVRGTGPGGRIVSEDVPAAGALVAPLAVIAGNSAAVASVAARNLADLLGIDLSAVAIDPVEGRITREGVAAYVRQRLVTPGAGTPTAAAPARAELQPAMQPPARVIRMSGMRGTIAKRMHASLQEMAQLTLTMDADMDAVVVDRERRKAAGTAPGFTDYIVAAAAKALSLHPDVNAQVTAEGIAVLPDVHVGLAVALDSGLMVPVVRHADRLTLEQLAAETSRLAAAARAGQLAPADLEGGTFSVSALGMYGVDAFTPVINPPNVAILGVGRLRDDLVLRDGQVVTTTRLTLSLTWDHRVLDGAPAAEFCRSICQQLAAVGS